ncbi:hypothetical protein ACUXDX_001686 [Staphylococcus epidermidis]|uniref:hypothetical protein n=1 Tax=Staphylococcus epidermidis TaxID=1282 RepID=UPI0019347CF1|nr:hypothetical protein [Staphylococcus epidermidis]MBM0752545.1 hypothetical protein [Staphylococcus epidermidis]MBM0765243.1 hypothetical protein [Staphylococcus epidermidis]MBM0789518.1 hypothetical protein [Staphylococcus epidermidis]
MKKYYFFIILISLLVIISGCSFNDLKSKNDSSNRKIKNKKTVNYEKSTKNINNLSEKEKVALALSDPSISHKAISAKELSNHSYTKENNGPNSQESIDVYELNPSNQFIKGSPNDMKFYEAEPHKGSFITLIGISKDRILIVGTQSEQTYNQYINTGNGIELNLHKLLNKYGKNNEYKKIAEQISIVNDSKSNDISNNKMNNNDKNSKEYFAKVWLTIRQDINETFVDDNYTYDPIDRSETPIYSGDSSASLPKGTIQLSPNPTALGTITFKDNGNGTVTFYDVPSHFQDSRWSNSNYVKKETQKILNHGKTKKIVNPPKEKIEKVASHITSDTPQKIENDYLNDNNSSNDQVVNRTNVIDKVEEYEGHKLDKDLYTYKEPEENENGDWGFSFLNKDNSLAGSYIIKSNGKVIKYDEDGKEIQ